MKCYIAMEMHKAIHTEPPREIEFPKGCVGVLYVFKTKKAARAFSGKKVPLETVVDKQHKSWREFFEAKEPK